MMLSVQSEVLYLPSTYPPMYNTSIFDTYPRYRELNGLINKRCNGDTRYMKLSCSPDRPRTSFAGYERINTVVTRVLKSRITRSGD